MRQQFRPMIVIVCLLAGLAWPMRTAQARVRLENICTVYGQQEVHLTGLGLVVGLSGTGDGGKNLPTMRALAAALKLMNTPVLSTEELNNADNVAIVMVEATIPPTGLRRGQKIDCYVSSVMGAKSLRGGRLLVTPLETSNISDDTVVGLASGAVSIENATVSTTGVIKQGLVLEEDFISLFVDRERGHIVTLLLDEAHSSFHAASEVSRVIDSEFSFDAENQRLAHPVSPGVVEVTIPEQYHDSPVEFIAQVLEVGIDNPHTQARVIVNEKTQTIIVTGEVEISPTLVTHGNLVVEVGVALDDESFPPITGQGTFVSLLDQQTRQSPQQLRHLFVELNQLQVPTLDMIAILRELHRSGKLHAAYEER